MISTSNFPNEGFEAAFSAGLHRIVDSDPTPGGLILVASNGMLLDDPDLHSKTKRESLKFAQARTAIQSSTSEDEVTLGLAIDQGLIGDPETVQMLEIDDGWGFYYSAFRSLRPYREGSNRITTLKKPFDPNGFNFEKIRNECFWHGQIGGVDTRVYYNKFPFTANHTLLVPNQDSGHPQYLEQPYHNFAWELAASASPGTSIGYNSLGAYASINHLHFHMVTGNAKGLPVENPRLAGQKYPAYKLEFGNAADAWEYIEALHAHNQPYNLIYLPDKTLVFPRKFQGTYPQPEWSTGFAWFELGGNFVVKSASDLRDVSAGVIRAAYDEIKPEIRVA